MTTVDRRLEIVSILVVNGHVTSRDVGRILRTFKIKKNVEVTDNGKDDF